MNRRFLVRATLLILSITIVLLILASIFPQAVVDGLLWLQPVNVPPQPQVHAERGALPSGVVGLQEWVQEPGGAYRRNSSSGFLLQIDAGQVVGVTTAHSLFQGDPGHVYEHIALGVNAQATPLAVSAAYYGPPGVAFSSHDLSVDYTLLKLEDAASPYALSPDPRGAPQPGERVALFSGLGDGRGGPLRWDGTVISVEPSAVIVYMDPGERFPGGMSGSPVLSLTTGKVVGMATGASLRGTRWLIGLHPMGHLLALIRAATEFPEMNKFRR